MIETLDPNYRNLLQAVSFAARAHRGQVRKDGQTPYHSHVFRVCLILRHFFGIDDPSVLTAAVLHDTLEDTTTDYDDLLDEFGKDVADWVAALSKDKRLVDPEREDAYKAVLAKSGWQVKVCKLADVFDNLTDSERLSADQLKRTLRRSRDYLQALSTNLPDRARRPFEIVQHLLAEMEAKRDV